MKMRARMGAAALLAVFVGLAGCEGPNGEGEEPRGATGRALVVLDVPAEEVDAGAALLSASGGLSRTRLPERSGWVYSLGFTDVEGRYSHDEAAVTPGVPVEVTLEAGAWVVSALARKGDVKVGWGSTTVVVAGGADTSAGVTLTPITGAGLAGSFVYTVTLPEGARGSFSLQTPEGRAVADGTVTLGEGVNAGSITLDSGAYILIVAVSGPEGSDGLVDAAHIYPEEATPFTWEPVLTARAPLEADDYDLSGLLAAPVADSPVAPAAVEAAHYTGEVVWKTSAGERVSGNFAQGTVYAATLSLTAKAGWTFVGTAADAFRHSGAVSVSNPANAGLVTVVFPATAGEGVSGDVSISIGFGEAITIAGDDGVNTLYKAGTPSTLSLSASDVFSAVRWYVETTQVTGGLSDSGRAVLLRAADYEVGRHTVTFLGSANGVVYSKLLALTIEEGEGEEGSGEGERGEDGADGGEAGVIVVDLPTADNAPLISALAALAANSGTRVYRVKLTGVTTLDTRLPALVAIIRASERYVNLDLSACSGGSALTAKAIGSAIKEAVYIKGLSLPQGLATVENSAFAGFTGLASVVIPNSVTSVGNSAFSGCTGLASVVIPLSVTSIGYSAFYECAGLTSVTIPNSVTSIGGSAFSGCTGLSSVTIPNSVTSLGSGAFSGCAGLTRVVIGNGLTSIGGDYWVSGGGVFSGCTSLTSVTIPDSVTSLGGGAFSGCTRLASVTIPNSVTTIGDRAFADCTGLIGVSIGSGVTTIGYLAFYGCTSLPGVTIPDSVTVIRAGAFSGCTALARVVIGNGVTSIGGDGGSEEWGAFSGCTRLTSVTLPKSVTSIGAYAFFGCTGLASVTLSSSLTTIGASAFFGCSGLTGIVIPAGVTTIGASAFYSTALVRVTFEKPRTSFNTSGYGTNSQSFPYASSLYSVYTAAAGGAGTYVRTGSTWAKEL